MNPTNFKAFTKSICRLLKRLLIGAFLTLFLTVPMMANAKQELQDKNCRLIESKAPTGAANDFQLPDEYLTKFVKVYERIAAEAGTRPILLLCKSPYFIAQAAPFGSNGILRFSNETLRLIAGDDNLLARIMGHEFAHLLLRHSERFRGEVISTEDTRQRNVFILWQQGSSLESANNATRNDSLHYLMAFSRQNEMEADDQGFVFSTKAGFSLNVAPRIAELLSTLGDPSFANYLSGHPGYVVRYQLAAFNEKSESFRQDSREYLIRGDFRSLGKVVNRWIAGDSQSGAAFLYKAYWLDGIGSPKSLVSSALDDSVEKFELAKSTIVSQLSHVEKAYSSPSLCISLIDEGMKIEGLNCLKKLSEADMETVLRVTQWKGNVIVDKPDADDKSALWSAVDSNGTVYLTNLDGHKDPNYMRPVKPWRPHRNPRAWENAPIAKKVTINRKSPIIFDDIFDAARSGTEVDVYEKLMAGADPNANAVGLTVLGGAVLAGNRETVEYLLKAGADRNKRDGFRQTPLEYAVRIGRIDLIDILQKPASAKKTLPFN